MIVELHLNIRIGKIVRFFYKHSYKKYYNTIFNSFQLIYNLCAVNEFRYTSFNNQQNIRLYPRYFTFPLDTMRILIPSIESFSLIPIVK